MKVLLTGSTGYIGHQLALKLASRNFEVTALVRDLKSNNIPQHKNIIPFKGDVCDYESVQNAVKGCDYIFHTAAFTDIKCNTIDKFYTTNVLGTKNIMMASLNENVKKVVYTSTLSVFGSALSHVPITEDQPRISSYKNDFELTKKMSEEVVLEYVNKGVTCSILNLTRVYGPGLNTYSNGVNKIISKIMYDKVLYVPDKLNIEANYVYIDDVLNAQLLALENGLNGEKYIIGGENEDYKGLFNRIKTISKSKISIVKINYKLIKNGLVVLNGFNSLLGTQTLVTPKVLDSLFTDRSASSKKAMAQLNYKITPLDVGLDRTINFLSK